MFELVKEKKRKEKKRKEKKRKRNEMRWNRKKAEYTILGVIVRKWVSGFARTPLHPNKQLKMRRREEYEEKYEEMEEGEVEKHGGARDGRRVYYIDSGVIRADYVM